MVQQIVHGILVGFITIRFIFSLYPLPSHPVQFHYQAAPFVVVKRRNLENNDCVVLDGETMRTFGYCVYINIWNFLILTFSLSGFLKTWVPFIVIATGIILIVLLL